MTSIQKILRTPESESSYIGYKLITHCLQKSLVEPDLCQLPSSLHDALHELIMHSFSQRPEATSIKRLRKISVDEIQMLDMPHDESSDSLPKKACSSYSMKCCHGQCNCTNSKELQKISWHRVPPIQKLKKSLISYTAERDTVIM